MIISLPITIRDTAPLGYWLTPILIDALSKQFHERGILFFGETGLRSPTSHMRQVFQGHLDFLSVTCERKSDLEFGDELVAMAERVLQQGTVVRRKQDCYCCPCGCLELPVIIALFAKEKTFARLGGAYVCKACNKPGELASIENEFLVIEPIESLGSVGVYPSWYRSELNDLIQQLYQQGVPVSRSRETGLFHGGMNLDVEFVWSLMLLLLSRQHPGERIRLVVTNHVLRQAAVALLLAKAFNPDLGIDLIIPPYISHPGSSGKWSISRLVELGFTGDLLRFMLIGSLGWQMKDAVLYDAPAKVEHRRFSLLKRRIQEVAGEYQPPYVPHDSLRNLCQQNLTQGLKHVFNPERFRYQTLLGLF